MDASTSSPVRIVSGRSSLFPGRGIVPWLIAWGLAVIVAWWLWSLARIRRKDWPDIALPDTNAPAEEA